MYPQTQNNLDNLTKNQNIKADFDESIFMDFGAVQDSFILEKISNLEKNFEGIVVLQGEDFPNELICEIKNEVIFETKPIEIQKDIPILQNQIDLEKELKLELTLEEVNLILEVLSELPARISIQLIKKIKTQIQSIKNSSEVNFEYEEDSFEQGMVCYSYSPLHDSKYFYEKVWELGVFIINNPSAQSSLTQGFGLIAKIFIWFRTFNLGKKTENPKIKCRLIIKTVIGASEVIRELQFEGNEKDFAKWEKKQLKKLDKLN